MVTNGCPLIQSNRLILRSFCPTDTDIFLAAMKEEDGASITGFEAWRTLAMLAGSWSLEGCGYWVVELRELSLPIGRIGAFSPKGADCIEFGWHIFRGYRGHRFAQEAAVAALRWMFAQNSEACLTMKIVDNNTPSEAVATSLGAFVEQDGLSEPIENHRIWRVDSRGFFASKASAAFSYAGISVQVAASIH